MISVDAVTVEFNGSALFSDITFNINENDRIALMGKNGAGKSTLLKIIAGVTKPTRGKVSAPNDATIAYLPQHLLTEDRFSVFEEASKAFSKILNMKTEMDEMNHQLETRTDYESDDYAKIIEKVSELSEKYYSIEEINFDAEVEKTLMGLGFVRSDFTRPTSEFSGGWRMRIELAKILLQKPDLILLDEPTNHMDIESIQWLEEFLINNAKAVIVISHYKTFVDNLTNRTIEVTMGRIYDYKTNYTHYLQLRKERREQQQKQFDDQAKDIADITAFGIYMGFWFPEIPQWIWVLMVVLLISSLNLTQVKVFAETEFWLTLVKVSAIIAMIVGGAVIRSEEHTSELQSQR